MASNAVAAVGTKFYRWDGTEWDALAEVTGIEGPNRTRETIDVTNLDSDDGYREFIGSFRDGGTVTLSMNFTRTTFALMDTDFESDAPGNYKIVLPDSDETSLEFEGLVTETPLTINVGDKISANVTIKVSGKPIVSDNSSGTVYGD